MPVTKGVLNTKTYFASHNYTEDHVISMPNGMIELKKSQDLWHVCMIFSGGLDV
jgi:hypothetical protein